MNLSRRGGGRGGLAEDILQVQGLAKDGLNNSKDTTIQ